MQNLSALEKQVLTAMARADRERGVMEQQIEAARVTAREYTASASLQTYLHRSTSRQRRCVANGRSEVPRGRLTSRLSGVAASRASRSAAPR
jgi:hypothetical protein